jgi:hypothetical protein
MATRRSVGIAGGEYKGAGQGDISSSLDEDVIASGSGDSFDTGDIDISTSEGSTSMLPTSLTLGPKL